MKRKQTTFLITCLLMLGTVCLGILVTLLLWKTSTSIARASGGGLPTGLHVVGNQIKDGNNNTLIPHGINRMGTEYQCTKSGTTDFDGPVDQASVSAMQTWNVNIVRVPLNEDCWLGINGFPANGNKASQYQTDIVNWVNLLNQNGMIVIVELHWNAPGSQQATGQERMPDQDHAPDFWKSVAKTFKSNSSVIFDLYNEPYTSSWSCWKDGSSAPSTNPCSDVSFAVAGMQSLVDTVRATGATNIIMLGGLDYSNDLSDWLAHEPSDSQKNLVASVHIYNFNRCNNDQCWNSEIAPVNNNVPVLVGELGENDCASVFIDPLMTWLDKQKQPIGYLAWTWTATGDCGGTPALITDYTGTPTDYGRGYKTHLLSLGGGSTPTPAPTHTPTPAPTNTPTPAPTHTSDPSVSCKIAYTVLKQWDTGFTANITIINTGLSTINGWKLAFSFPKGQKLINEWSGNFTQQGARITVTSINYNSTISPGSSTIIGFNASYIGTNNNPTSFTLNNQQCITV